MDQWVELEPGPEPTDELEEDHDEYQAFSETCSDTLPVEAYYTAYGASTIEDKEYNDKEPNSKYNYVGGNPLMLPEQEWPHCAKHGPLMFLWSMTDQKHLEDPSIIQCFMCAHVGPLSFVDGGKSVYPNYFCELTLDEFKGKYGLKENESIHFCDYRKNGYLIRRFYPRSDIFEAQKSQRVPMELPDIVKIKQETESDNKVHEFAELDMVWPKKYLKWESIKIVDFSVFPSEGDFIMFPNGGHIHYDQAGDFKRDNLRELKKHALLHHTRGIVEQTDLELFGDESSKYKHGYIVMMRCASGLPVLVDDNIAHLNISYDLVMRFLD